MGHNHRKIILASSSPRRLELLREMGIDCEVVPSTVDESAIPADHPRTFAIRAAFAKATDVASRSDNGSIVIAADTIVTRNMMIYGKPRDRADARRILRQLSGDSHQVITGVAIAKAGSSEVTIDSETTEVIFREVKGDEIDRYLDSAQVMDKAGAYGIQEEGGRLIDRISGDYYNVVGLPCALVARMLDDMYYEIDVEVPAPPDRWRR